MVLDFSYYCSGERDSMYCLYETSFGSMVVKNLKEITPFSSNLKLENCGFLMNSFLLKISSCSAKALYVATSPSIESVGKPRFLFTYDKLLKRILFTVSDWSNTKCSEEAICFSKSPLTAIMRELASISS